jgi:hypothetical protein
MRTSPAEDLYLVVAAVVAAGDREAVERQLRVAAGRRRHRVHWHDETDAVRLRLLDAVATQPLEGVAAVVEPVVVRRQEAARSQAWWSLLWHLHERHVDELVIEARQEQLNRRDRRTIATIQRAGIATDVSYRFGLPSEEATLWAADVVAGALGTQLATGDCRYADRLPDRLREVHRVAG